MLPTTMTQRKVTFLKEEHVLRISGTHRGVSANNK
jgi:hypothetical protein